LGLGFKNPTKEDSYLKSATQQRQNPFHLTEDLADAQGQFSEKTNFFQANCWPNQVNPAVISAVDVVTGASATGTSNAYTC